MGMLARVVTEPRRPQVTRVPYSGRTLAGVYVNEDNAVTISAVWACLRYLSQTVAVPPWHVMRRDEKGADVVSTHPVDWLLWKRPSSEWSSFQFRETLTHWALRWGNGYAEIEPDQAGRPFAMWPVHPSRVIVCRATEASTDDYGVLIRQGEVYYEVDNQTSRKVVLAARSMFHIRGFGETVVGANVIAYAAESLGWARAAQLFGASFFGNGANIAGVVINKKPLKPEGLRKQKAEFDQLYKGVRNAHKTAHLDNDADFKPIGVDPKDAALIQTHYLLVEEVCRWFGVPPHKVMHLLRSTFSNIEHQAIEVVVDSITPWVKRFEDEADFKLFGNNRQGLYSKMNLNAYLRGDSTARMAWHKGMRDMGAYSVNDVLRYEDERSIGPEGDKHTMQSGFTTLERIGEEKKPRVPALPAPSPEPEEDPEADAENAAAAEILGLVDA